MGDFVEIGAADGHRFKAYRAQAKGDVKGTVIIAPEIFGVNNHIRSVADTYAAQGYFTLAPQLFDRSEPDYEAGYEQTDVAAGIAIIESIEFDEALRDLAACVAYAQGHGKVAVVGYCWGGTIAWLAAASTEGLLRWWHPRSHRRPTTVPDVVALRGKRHPARSGTSPGHRRQAL